MFPFLQQRPEYVGDRGLLDVRVRQAIAHAIDRQAINSGIYDGLGAPTESPVPPNAPFYPAVDRLMTRYPLDVNRASQLMSDAGYTKDGEGFFSDARGSRFHLDFAVFDSAELKRMQAILSDSWRRAGFDVRTAVIASTRFTQPETRQTLPGTRVCAFPRRARFPLARGRNGGKPVVRSQSFGLDQPRVRSTVRGLGRDARCDRAGQLRRAADGPDQRRSAGILPVLSPGGEQLGGPAPGPHRRTRPLRIRADQQGHNQLLEHPGLVVSLIHRMDVEWAIARGLDSGQVAATRRRSIVSSNASGLKGLVR